MKLPLGLAPQVTLLKKYDEDWMSNSKDMNCGTQVKAPPRILVVEDDAQIRTLLREMLEGEGYEVRDARTGFDMIAVLEREAINLITLDLNLGGEDGLALAREVRAKRDVPIMMISAKATELDRVVGLELGADDYVTKPFSVREVLARVRAVLRRYEAPTRSVSVTASGNSDDETFRFDGWVLDMTGRALKRVTGELEELTTAEFNLLALFVRRPSRVLSRDTIMDLLKGNDWTPLDRSIDGLVSRLRRKIEPDAEHPTLIKTVRGVGYVFAANVKRA